MYSLTPANKVYPGGDNEAETPHLDPHVLTLNAVAFGDASPEDKAWARGELVRLRMVDRDYFLYDALAAVGDKPVTPPRTAWPTWYVSSNTGTLYARTRWDESAVWFAAECHGAIETDHRHHNASTFALSRGKDDVIVDPTPYGSQSTLTTNAATVMSGHLPKDYIPSQGLWGEKVSYDFVTQRASGVVAARCDYTDAYKFQHRPTDVPEAIRDWVLVPNADGTNAALVVIDRADTGGADRSMHLRFRTPGVLALQGETATAAIGATKLTIASAARSSGKASLGKRSGKDCYKEGTAKGRCEAARFEVTDYKVVIDGPRPTAVHVISATDSSAATIAPLSGEGWAGVRLAGIRDAVIVWRTSGGGGFSYKAGTGTHVILDAIDGANVTGKRDGDTCALTVSGEGETMKPVVITVDAACAVTMDPEAAAASAIGTKPKRVRATSRKSGCCGAEAAPGTSFAMAFVVLALLWRRRRAI